MGIPILVRWHIDIDSFPRSFYLYSAKPITGKITTLYQTDDLFLIQDIQRKKHNYSKEPNECDNFHKICMNCTFKYSLFRHYWLFINTINNTEQYWLSFIVDLAQNAVRFGTFPVWFDFIVNEFNENKMNFDIYLLSRLFWKTKKIVQLIHILAAIVHGEVKIFSTGFL